MKDKKIVYYSDPLNDDFADNDIKTRYIPLDFCYVHKSVIWNVLSFLLYYVIALPLVWFMAKVILGLKFKNRRVIRKLKGQGFFLYGNHTQPLDAYVPPLAAFPKRSYTLANPDAVSIPGIKNLVMMLGALPVPSQRLGFRPFIDAINTRLAQNSCIAVYPEAHIWPYYTGVRPFRDSSFRYPVMMNAPAVAMVTTYRKRKGLFRFVKRPGMTVSFSEVFYPDKTLTDRQSREDLRNRAFEFMDQTARTAHQVEYIRYEYRPKEKRDRVL